jgi:hypothetical protein
MKKIYFPIAIILAIAFIFSVAGCKKDADLKAISPASLNAKMSQTDSMVMTPMGLIPKSHVFQVENGYHLEIQNNRVLKMSDKTHTLMKDLASIQQTNVISSNLQSNSIFKSHHDEIIHGPTVASNWQTYSQWYNGSGVPINYFSTSWIVPSNPTNTTDNQYFYIFNALTPAQFSAEIIQPVLQWGNTLDGGGAHWAIANWYGWADASGNQFFAVSSLITVSPGTTLTGIITNTGNNGSGSQNYTCAFSGYSNTLTIVKGDQSPGYENGISTTVTIPTVSQESWAFEVLEAYNRTNTHGGYDVTQATDYPNDLKVKMTNIKLLTNNSTAPLSWAPEIGSNTYFGESCNIVSSNASGSGEVDLYFHPIVINGQAAYSWSSSGSGSGTISATPGALVSLNIAAFGPGNSVNFSMSGAQLSPPANSSNSVSITNNDIPYTFVMPASGSVNWSANYTTPAGGGSGNIAPSIVAAPTATINGATNYKWTSGGSASGTIVAPAGQVVYITFNAEASGLSTTFNLTGAIFSGSTSGTVTVSNNYVVKNFTMPSSGSVTWSGTFTPGAGQGEIDVD